MGEPAEAVEPLGEVALVPLVAIRPYPGNARRIPAKAVEQTAKSIRAFGWQQPLVLDPERVIVAGHVRFAAAKLLGLAEAPAVFADRLSPEQIRAYRITDNRSHDYTAWDYGLLADEIDGLDEAFADVLDLADWRTVIDEFESLPPGLELGTAPESLFSLGHRVTVIFESAEAADAAGPEILKLDGVLDVRYSG